MIEKKEIETALSKYKKIEENTNDHTNKALNICVSALVQAVPVFGTVLTETAEKGLEIYRDNAKKKLIGAILECEDHIDPDKIDGVSFIMEFAKTQEVITKLANQKKLDYFCNLFCNHFILESHYDDVDIFEEYLEHLSTLSYREIDLLISLYNNERKVSGMHVNSEFDRKKEAYKLFRIEVSKKGINIKQLEGMLVSITRSGFCKGIKGFFSGYDEYVYNTTAYFHNFLSYINKRNIK